MKSYLKNMGAILAQSLSKEFFLAILFAFVAVMMTIGAQGQPGLAVKGLEAVYYGDEVGSSILAGQTFESLIATDQISGQLEGEVQFFLIKALISLFLFVVFLYFVFVSAESAIWNAFTKKLSLKGLGVRLRLNLLLFFIILTTGIIIIVLYTGLQYFRIIAFLDIILYFIGGIILVFGSVSLLHLFLTTNMLATKRKSVRTILKEFLKFKLVELRNLVPIYIFATVLLLILAALGSRVILVFPNFYGLASIITLIIPLVWLRQLLYLNWTQNTKPTKKQSK